MSDLECLSQLLSEAISGINKLDVCDDFHRGIRMGYLHCRCLIGLIEREGSDFINFLKCD